MNIEAKFAGLEVGYNVPAIPGMSEDEIQTPCLILDLDALERNVRKMGDYARAHNTSFAVIAGVVSISDKLPPAAAASIAEAAAFSSGNSRHWHVI
jgi:D-serine deaminase-like pyridoxal phosphate-dependent protein